MNGWVGAEDMVEREQMAIAQHLDPLGVSTQVADVSADLGLWKDDPDL
jgi:hypothetical protein